MISYTGTKARQLFLLNQYMNNQIDLTNSMNILMNIRSTDYYVSIGKHFIEACKKSNKKTKEIEFSLVAINKKRKIEDSLRSVAIFFITSFLNKESLEKMFGRPIYHNQFGEGFDEEDNIPNYNCLSYFIEINGDIYHITYDHRGTSLEVPLKGDPEKIFSDIKELIDLYIDKS